MSDPVLVVRVAANMAELRANLADGVSQIETTSTAMRNMAASYDGSRTIAQAGAVMAAIQQIGGVTKLTEDEQSRANTTIQAALDKYAALGKTAPAGMKELADATSQASHETGGFIGWVEGLGHSMVARIAEGVLLRDAVRELINIGKEAFADAAQFEDLSKATGLSVQAIQQFSYVGAEFGLGVEEMARGVEQLSAKLANGDKNATNAVEMLGLNIKDLLAAGPEEAFLQIAEAVGHVEDPMTKGGLAAELFGGKLAKTLLPMLGDLRGKLDEASKSTAMMDDATVKAAHDFEVGWSHALTTAKAWVAEGASAMWSGLVKINDVLSASMLAEAGFTAETAKATAATKASADAHTDHAAAQQHVITNAELLANRLAALRADALVPLTAAQRSEIVELEKYGVGQAEIAKLIGTTEIAVHQYEAAVKSAAEAAKKAAAEQVTAQKLAFETEAKQLEALIVAHAGYEKAVQAGSHDTLAAQTADIYTAANVRISELAKAKALTAETEQYIREAADLTAAHLLQKEIEADIHSKAHFLKLADDAKIAFDFAMAHADQYSADWIQKLRDTADAAKLAADTWGLSFDTALTKIDAKSNAVANDVAMTWQHAMGLVTQGLGTLSGTVGNAPLTNETRAATQLAYDQGRYYGPVLNGNQTNPRGSGPDFAALGYKAEGGPVAAGSPYVVGERGPELFVPNASGSIIPNGGSVGGGGNTTIQVYVTQPLGTPDAIARAVGEALDARARNTGTRMPVAA